MANTNLQAFTEPNDQSRKRLAELVGSLSSQELERRVSYGWTVAMALAHLAFWDYYGVARLEHWEKNGFPEHHPDSEPINDALRPMLEALPAQEAKRMVLAAADAVDRKVRAVKPDLVSAIIGGGHERALNRAAHRDLHLEDIEKALGRAGGGP